jgi:hypothetical protein
LDAEVFHREMKAGRNHALLIGARRDDDALVECVIKLPGLMENPALHPVPSLLEWMGAALARELGIYTPEPYEVIVTRAFAESIPRGELRPGAVRSVGSVFGSGFVRGTQIAPDILDASMRAAAAAVVAFDVFIHNVDRRRENPNLLLCDGDLFAFDHAEAFAFIWSVIGADPVTDSLTSMVANHALALCVRKRGAPDLGEFRARLAALSDARLDEIAAATPTSWQVALATGKLGQLLDILRRRRDAVDHWLPQVEAWMER